MRSPASSVFLVLVVVVVLVIDPACRTVASVPKAGPLKLRPSTLLVRKIIGESAGNGYILRCCRMSKPVPNKSQRSAGCRPTTVAGGTSAILDNAPPQGRFPAKPASRLAGAAGSGGSSSDFSPMPEPDLIELFAQP